MIEQQRQKIELELTRVIDDIDKTYLRKMQAEMHRCAAKCCDNDSLSMEKTQSCIENCSIALTKSQAYIQSEIENFQNRLQRCVMDCNDTVKDKMGPNPSNDEVQKYTSQFESCAVNCVDKHINILPNMLKTMKEVLANNMKTLKS